jgi:hypothetical protein
VIEARSSSGDIVPQEPPRISIQYCDRSASR